jgi:hypothetical protein
MDYVHVQNAPQWVVVTASVSAIVMFSLITSLARSEHGAAGLILLATLWVAVIYLAVLNATRLTVRVGGGTIDLSFRLGWPRESIDRASVTGISTHRNSWIEGWGIRKVRGGWMWNVWGLDSVQLELDTGKVFRIGTDDAAGLTAALQR